MFLSRVSVSYVARCISFLIYFSLSFVDSLDNGLARTPPMGWMHWERFRCITDCEKYPDECISENLFKRTADLLVSEGYSAAGYKYVIIDDCWMEVDRDNETKRLVADQERFPGGIKALAEYIHKNDLLFGIYGDIGNCTCAGYPGSSNYMSLDTQTFAEWDVDYVKLDGCYTPLSDIESKYEIYGKFLNATGRPMVYSCSWPAYQEEKGIIPDYERLKTVCNLWRNWNDISDSFESVVQIMDYFSKNQKRIQPHGGPGHWNDPDMLILGNFGLSYDQSKMQMAVWCILAAPLLMSADIRLISPEIKNVLQNPYVIAVNQDPLGIQGKMLFTERAIEIWSRPITPINSNGEYSYAIAFVSRRSDGHARTISILLSDMDLKSFNGYRVTDLFDNNNHLGNYKSEDYFDTRVNPNGVVFCKFEVLDEPFDDKDTVTRKE